MTDQQKPSALSRRRFLEIGSATGVGLFVGFHIPVRSRFSPLAASAELNAFIHIGTDEVVTIFVNESEMGQGVLTSLPMILADELEADWSKIQSKHAPADSAKFGRQGTGGSSSVRVGYPNLRKAGAAAREMLIAAAAEEWDVDPATCNADNGSVVHPASRRRLTFGKLAAKAATQTPPDDPPLKDPKDFRFIGKPMNRIDTPAKVRATAEFGIDVRVPGMLTAQVVHSPVFGGTVRSFDATQALAVKGVRHVVQIPSGVAVVADNFWAATKGRDALSVTWDEGAHAGLSSSTITQMCQDLVENGADARNDGNAESALEAASQKLEAVYEVPYLAHATMEPMNCTADVRADRCEVWAPTQSPSSTKSVAQRITGLAEDRVSVLTTFMGGGFGRRSATDFVEDAVHTSKAVGKPVKVIWTREDDTRDGHYRPTTYNRMLAGLGADGQPVAWIHKIAGPSILDSFGRELRNGIDGSSVEGASNIPYGIPNVHVTYALASLPIPVHWWRSVGSSQNAYVTECFVDELAAAARQDPVEFRLGLMGEHKRHARVLQTAARMAQWGSRPPDGRARGVAVHESFGSFVAEVAEVSVANDGTVRVHRVWCAVDCGDVVNPATIKDQMESGIAYGLSAALYGKVEIRDGRAVQSNFHDYPVVRMNEMPRVDVEIVTSGDPMGGIGEPGTPPIAPAVCNAIYAATGKRIRRLPIGKVV